MRVKSRIGYLLIIAVFIFTGLVILKSSVVTISPYNLLMDIKEGNNDRILYWKTTIEMIKDYPLFGVGIGIFKLYYIKYRTILLGNIIFSGTLERAEQVHNEYLQIWAEMGVLGIGSVLVFISFYFYSVIKFISNPLVDVSVRMCVLGMASSVLSVLIYAITSFPFHIVPTSILTVVCLGFSETLIIRNLARQQI